MTTIAVRSGVMAADSRMTINGNALLCTKLFRRGGDIIGVAGDDAPALLFIDWYKSGRARPEILVTGAADFYALVLDEKRRVWLFDKWCRGERLRSKFFAIGSGADVALGAMYMGADAVKACRIACRVDPNSGLPVVRMAL